MMQHAFNAMPHEVRGILAVRQSQARRVVRPQPPDGWGGASERVALAGHCPYGAPGDRLWLRETWCCDHAFAEDYDAMHEGGRTGREDCQQ